MNQSRLSKFAWILGGLLSISLLSNAFLVVHQVSIQRQARAVTERLSKDPQLQVLMNNSSQIQNMTRNLLVDLVNYAQQQPSILPILKKYGVSPAPQTPQR